MDTLTDPIPVIQLEYANPDSHRSQWRGVVGTCHWIALLSCWIGVLWIAFISTELGVLSGIPITVAGLILIIGAAVSRDVFSIALGICYVSICILFLILVNLLNWNPAQAHLPFSLMGTIFSMGTTLLSFRWGVLWRATRNP